MTREEFENLDGDGLVGLICEYDIYDIWDHLMDYDSINDRVWDNVSNWGDGWAELRDYLNSIPDYSRTGYFWMDDWGDIESLDTDEELRACIYEDILDYFESNDLFEEEEENDEPECTVEDGVTYYRDDDGNRYTVELENVSVLLFE